MKVFKYTLKVTDEQTIEIPSPADLLTVQIQHGMPQLWAIVDENTKTRPITLLTVGTGNPMPDNYRKYLGTYQLSGGALVFHVFESI